VRGGAFDNNQNNALFSQAMYETICDWDNLLLAYRNAAAGKRGRASAATFEYRLEDNLLDLQEQLAEKTYQPGRYTHFTIHEPKRRLISAAPFRDRVVHHALCNLIEPVFERGFIFDSYANRVGKGTHRALDRCQEFARRYRYALQCDVEQFFPAIDHAILRQTLARRVEDVDVLWLIDRIIDSGRGVLTHAYDMRWFPGDALDAASRPRGLPIGNLTSQFWANCYLDPLDQFVTRGLGCGAYLRYVDDVCLFSDSKAQLHDWHEAIKTRLAKLRLTLHDSAQPRPVEEGLPYLGFVIFPERRRLKRRKGIHFGRALRKRLVAYASGDCALDDVTAMVRGWVNHTAYANTTGLRKALFRAHPIPRKARNLDPESLAFGM
jgi:retron-type reverse transcriptase